MSSANGNGPPLINPSLRGGRTLLARVADASFWMSRYMERAEHIARILMISNDVLTGTGDLDRAFALEVAGDVLRITQRDHMFPALTPAGRPASQVMAAVARYMTLDEDNPNSLIHCMAKARENARGIRESISAEMWEQINTFYWSIKSDDARARFEDVPQEFYRQFMMGSFLFQGLADQTMDHGQVWLFIQLSKYIERVDMTCRILMAKFSTLSRVDSSLEPSLRTIQWMAVLRTCCSIEAYRRGNIGELEPSRVANFIIFDASFPRSIHYCVKQALASVDQIRAGLSADAGREAQRRLGRLFAEVQYSQIAGDTFETLLEFLSATRAGMAEAAAAVQEQWFMRAIDPNGWRSWSTSAP